MLNKLFCFLILAVLSFSLSSCTPKKNKLTLYILSASELENTATASEVKELVKKSGRLALTGDNIKGYDWEHQKIEVDESFVTSLTPSGENGGSRILKTTDEDGFVLMLSGEVLFFGGFEFGVKNPNVQLQPYIKDSSRYVFSFDVNKKFASKDNRYNGKLYNFLKKNELLVSQIVE